jgi:hypothetical protein
MLGISEIQPLRGKDKNKRLMTRILMMTGIQTVRGLVERRGSGSTGWSMELYHSSSAYTL